MGQYAARFVSMRNPTYLRSSECYRISATQTAAEVSTLHYPGFDSISLTEVA